MKKTLCVSLSIFILVIFLGLNFVSTSFASNIKKVTFYGMQEKGSVGKLPKISGDLLVVKKGAVIVSYTKSAPSFCVWKKYGSRGLVCSYQNWFIGYKLSPGKYWILPNIGSHKRYGKASVTVKCYECYKIKNK